MTRELQTRRMNLRRFQSGDADHLFDLDDDPEVMQFITGGANTPRHIIRGQVLPRFIREQDDAGVCGFWAAELRSDGRFAGWFTLRQLEGLPGQASLGYRLRREFWGQGIASEGARLLVDRGFLIGKLDRVIATTYEDNVASIAVMRRLGMQYCRAFLMSESALLELDTAAADPTNLFPGVDVEYEVLRDNWQACRPASEQSPAPEGQG